MSKRTMIGIALVGAIVLVALAVVGVSVWRRGRHLAALTAEAPAEILNVDVITNASQRNTSSSRRRRSASARSSKARDLMTGVRWTRPAMRRPASRTISNVSIKFAAYRPHSWPGVKTSESSGSAGL